MFIYVKILSCEGLRGTLRTLVQSEVIEALADPRKQTSYCLKLTNKYSQRCWRKQGRCRDQLAKKHEEEVERTAPHDYKKARFQ